MRRNAGFTLIEILVVIAIIAAILGGISLMVRAGMRAQQKMAASSRVQALGAAIDQLHAPDKLGMYPPTELELLKSPVGGGDVGKKLGSGGNDTNRGIEAVYVAVRLKGVKVTVDGFNDEGAIANLDGDKALEAVPDLATPELFEYLDVWGNPLVYISHRDYKNMKKVERYLLGDGREVKVGPKTLANGEFARPDSFQLFSLGPDGAAGTEDDIHYGQ